MLVEIEETVSFLTSFLYGTLPRRPSEQFAENLANRLIETVINKGQSPNVFHLVVNAGGKCDPIIQSAAEEAFMALAEVLSLLPNSLILEIRSGSVNALNAETAEVKAVYPIPSSPVRSQDYNRRFRNRNGGSSNSPSVAAVRFQEKPKRKPKLRLEHQYGCSEPFGQLCITSYFELERSSGVYTAKAFAATRFGSTKPKNHQRVDAGSGFHPYTTPSLYSYLHLLIFLNALACLTFCSEKLQRQAAANRGEGFMGQLRDSHASGGQTQRTLPDCFQTMNGDADH